jgi:hypothetical protein
MAPLSYACTCGFASTTATAFHSHLQTGRKAGELVVAIENHSQLSRQKL